MLARECLAIAVLLMVAVAASGRAADEAALATIENAAGPLIPSKTWVLIVAGHPGDDEYDEQFAEVVNRLSAAVRTRLRIDRDRIWIWSGVANDAASAVAGSRGPATREALYRDIQALRERAGEGIELWVIVVAHAHRQGPTVELNLPGADVDAEEFASWFAEFPCQRSVFFMTTSLSGRFIKPLSEPRRVVIAAAEGEELNGTLFPLALATQLEAFGQDGDRDDVGAPASTLLDLYLAVVRDVNSRYESEDLIPTEHAQLDDNGDGRGAEVQSNPGKPLTQPPRVAARAETVNLDGALAAAIRLELAPANPQPR